MSNYNTTLQSNNADLQAVLSNINKLSAQATPTVSVGLNGLITATAGTKSSTHRLAFQPAKTITPSTADQIAVSSGCYTGGDITVAAVPTQSKTATPTTSEQNVVPDSGKFLSKVTVNAIPSTYVKPSYTKSATTYTPSTTNQTISAGTYLTGVQTINGDANLIASNIKNGVSIFGVSGTHSGGIDTSDATATANKIFLNETAYINNEKVTGTFTIDNELEEQDDLISSIETALQNKVGNSQGINPNEIGTCTVNIEAKSQYKIHFVFTILQDGVLTCSHIAIPSSSSDTAISMEVKNVLCGSVITVFGIETLMANTIDNVTLVYDGYIHDIHDDGYVGSQEGGDGHYGIYTAPMANGSVASIRIRPVFE